MKTTAEFLDELREVLKGQKCRECGGAGKYENDSASTPWGGLPQAVSFKCSRCHGTGLNAAYDGLREVVWQPCPNAKNKSGHYHQGEWYPKGKSCGHQLTRSLEGMPIGALEGSLRWNLPPGWRLSVTGDKSFQATLDAGSRRFITTYWETPDLASVQAVLEAIKEACDEGV